MTRGADVAVGLRSHRAVRAARGEMSESTWAWNESREKEPTFGLAVFAQEGRVADDAIEAALQLS